MFGNLFKPKFNRIPAFESNKCPKARTSPIHDVDLKLFRSICGMWNLTFVVIDDEISAVVKLFDVEVSQIDDSIKVF